MATRTRATAVSPHPQQQSSSVGGSGRRTGGHKQMTSSSASTVTPPGKATSEEYVVRNQRMTVEKGVVDELLLVCSVIGSSTNDENEIVPVTDCLNWLQDLQRALRRDDDSFRPISLLMNKWKVVQQKLLPLVMSCRYDTAMVLTIVKILVILTKPLSEQTKKAGKMVIDTKSGKTPPEVIQEQIKLRENALAQSDMLMEYKRAIVHHSSHLAAAAAASLKTKKSKGQSSSLQQQPPSQKGLLSIFVSLLAEPLSKTGTSRSDTDHLTIELVLHLFRNLLSAEPLLKSSSEAQSRAHVLHQEIITLFERELVLDIILVIGQEMESRENAQYNLLMMELLHHLLKNQDPTAVARSAFVNKNTKHTKLKTINKNSKHTKENHRPNLLTGNSNRTPFGSTTIGSGSGLRAQLQREQQKFSTIQASRHSHFGGTLVTKRHDGKRQYLSTTTAVAASTNAADGGSSSTATVTKQATRKKNRKLEPFVGSGKTILDHTKSDYVSGDDHSPSSKRAQTTLYNFMERFTQDCYGPVMKSLKNEFRRDSVRLEENDKVIFYRIVWFICQWWRVSNTLKQKQQKKQPQQSTSTSSTSSFPLGQLIFTMDMFTFNLVLNSVDTFQQMKNHTSLAQTVALYREMMFQLVEMHQSVDPTESLMAVGLLDRIFYNSEPLDRLPKLLPKWTPGTYTREYLCDLVELTHMTLKVLELNSKVVMSDEEIVKQKQQNDTVAKMKATALDFDVVAYFSRKIVSNQLVTMYTHLLSQYTVNSTQVNHHIVAMFLRMCKFKIVANDEENKKKTEMEEEEVDAGLLPLQTVTLQPMLYNIQLICVLEQILNDVTIQRDVVHFGTILKFATSFMTQFAQDAKINPMLYVECLFRHPVPHRFCELSKNMYVNEELRMIAERDLLLEEQRRLRDVYDEEYDDDDGNVDNGVEGEDDLDGGHHLNNDDENKTDGGILERKEGTAAVDDSDEEETEWGAADDTEAGTTSTKRKKKKKLKKAFKKRVSVPQDEEEDESMESSTEESSSTDQKNEEANEEDADTGKRKANDIIAETDSGASSESEQPEPVEKKQRLRKLGAIHESEDDDDDDDDIDFGSGPVVSSDTMGAKKTTGGNRMIFDDDDEDD